MRERKNSVQIPINPQILCLLVASGRTGRSGRPTRRVGAAEDLGCIGIASDYGGKLPRQRADPGRADRVQFRQAATVHMLRSRRFVDPGLSLAMESSVSREFHDIDLIDSGLVHTPDLDPRCNASGTE
jgi:hypothetical protein